MSSFEIKYRWLEHAKAAADEEAASFAHVQIFVGKENITEHKSPRGRPEAALEVPLYYLAEWISENWWVILFEPRKDENVDDTAYLARHSIVAAQHGFPLPALSIMPFGRSIRLNSSRRHAPFANVEFIKSAYADAARDEIEQVLGKFISDTIKRLSSCGLKETNLATTWNEVTSLDEDEREFCQLVGSLGLSPADVDDATANALESIYDILGPRATRDFCLAATSEAVINHTKWAESVTAYLQQARAAKLTPLLGIRLPAENYSRPSWQRGMQAAKSLRDKFNVNIKDPRGADKIFELLEIDTTQAAHLPQVNDPNLLFAGAVDREGGAAKLALLQDDELHRRFGAGRATYLAWVSEGHSRRLVTNAVTRDQQASRSFAAEILIPQSYLTRLAGSKRELKWDEVRNIAHERRVMPDVAFKQAYNAGIRVPSI